MGRGGYTNDPNHTVHNMESIQQLSERAVHGVLGLS